MTTERRAADIGMSLFLASLVMFFGSLVSGYVLLRAGSQAWDTPWLRLPRSSILGASPWLQVVGLVLAAWLMRRYRADDRRPDYRKSRRWLPIHAAAMAAVVVLNAVDAALALLQGGHGPATSVGAGSWFVLTGTVALLVVGGMAVTAWTGWRQWRSARPTAAGYALERYWWLMATFQLVLAVGLYLV